jgi:hypothetical protein
VKLILYLLPILGAGAAVFFASMSAPKLGQQFAGAAFGFVKGAVTAIATGVMIGIGAAIGAGAGVIGGAMATAKGVRGKLGAAVKSLPKAAGATFKEGILRTPREVMRAAALAPMPEAMRKEAIESWRRRASREAARKYVQKVEEDKGAEGVLGIIKSPLATDVEKDEAILQALEKGYLPEEMAEKEKKRIFRLRNDAEKRGDKKTTAMIERRLLLTFGDEFMEEKIKRRKYTEKELDEDVKSGIITMEERQALKNVLDKIKEGKELTKEDRELLKTLEIRKVIDGVKTADDMKQLQKGVAFNDVAMEAMQKFWTGAQWATAGREMGREIVQALEPTIQKLREFKEKGDIQGYLQFVWERPGIARFSETTTAQEVGMPSWYEFAPEELKTTRVIRRETPEGIIEERIPGAKNMKEVLAMKPPTPPPPITPTETPTEKEKMKEELRRAEEKISEEEKKEKQK